MKKPTTRAEKLIRRQAMARAKRLTRTHFAKTVLAVHRAFPPPLPPSVRLTATGLRYVIDRKGISLAFINGYHDG